MQILNILKSVIEPIGKTIDSLVTSDEERLILRNKLVEIETNATFKLLDFQREIVQAQSKIITAEAQGESWLQRNWRPITMLTLLVLVVSYFIGLAPQYLIDNPTQVDNLFGIVKIGLGGYVVGRSGEKIAKVWKEK
jgi:hypothetical protein